MALEKSITNLRTGHANTYWRLTAVSVDAAAGCVAIVLSGYGSAEARNVGRQPDDRRDWLFGPQSFAAVAFQPANGKTVYDVIAFACYSLIRDERRPIAPGTVLDEDGSVVLPTGERVAADAIDKSVEPWTVPSEFADALNV
jgi:hypothetical protein